MPAALEIDLDVISAPSSDSSAAEPTVFDLRARPEIVSLIRHFSYIKLSRMQASLSEQAPFSKVKRKP
jgi:hypothetical protein